MERAAPRFPIRSCSRWGLPCLVDYSRSGGLLPHLFTLIRRCRTVCFLWHFPSRRLSAHLPVCILGHPWTPRLHGIAPCGVRTFLPWLNTKSDPPLIQDRPTLHETDERIQCSPAPFQPRKPKAGPSSPYRMNPVADDALSGIPTNDAHWSHPPRRRTQDLAGYSSRRGFPRA